MTQTPDSAPPLQPPARTLLLLVRHGVTPTTGQVLPGRAPGLHLAEQGNKQAQRFAERLQGLAVDAIYSSPMERALETAAPAAEATGLKVTHDDGLLECDFGTWTGAALSELYKLPQWREVQSSPSTFRFPDGESFSEMQERMVAALENIAAAHPGGVVICFSHADTIKAAVAHAMGTPLDNFQRIYINPASVSVIALVDGRPPEVLMVNSASEPLSGLKPSSESPSSQATSSQKAS